MNTALIGLDYIIDITHPEGKLAASAPQVIHRGVIGKANQALQLARQRNWLSFLVKVGYARGYADHPPQSPMFSRARAVSALESGSNGMEFHPELQAELADMLIVKPRVSAFYGTSLDAALRANGIERVVVAGVSTNWAVESTVRDAHDRDFEVFLLEDACAATDPEDHANSVRTMSRISRVVSIADLELL